MSKTSIACIAIKGKKILVAHRNPTGQMGGRWEFPGGKVEDGESDQTSIVREMQEEFGITVKPGEFIGEAVFEHNEKQVALHCYRIFVPRMGLLFKYRLTEHTEYKWISVDDVEKLNFVDSDMLLYPKVKEYVHEAISSK